MLLVAAFVVVADILVFLFMPLMKEMGKEQTADAPTAQKAAGNEEFEGAMLLVAAILAFSLEHVFGSPFAALA